MRALLWRALLGAGLIVAGAASGYAQNRGAPMSAPVSKSAAPAAAGRTAGGMTFASPEAAYDHGRGAMQSGHPELAIKAFEFAAENDVFLAQFFLARLYADNAASYTNHTRAFDLYQQIVTEHAEVDVDDDPRAPFVAKSMVALAGYFRNGLTAAGVRPDAEQAANLLRNAAKTFRDEEAQYEYAKLLLTGDGLAANPREGVYWLRGLSTRGYTAAQAFLADLYWRGTHVAKDQTQALLLITIAAENATSADRVWIEDKFQDIFCGAADGVRRQAQGAVADWRSKYGRAREELSTKDGLATIQPRALRTCRNGELAQPLRHAEPLVDGITKPRGDVSAGLRPAAPTEGFMQGNTMGFTLQGAGQTTLAPTR